jgi:NADH:ubiquinone oxidoreductase subunit E
VLALTSDPEATIIEQLISDLSLDEGDMLAALHRVQERFGYISRPAVDAIAHHFHITSARVFATASFYSDLRLSPAAATRIEWCGGPACRLKGGENVRIALESTLGIKLGEATPDGRVELHEAQCDGSCHQAALVWVNGRVHGPMGAADAVRLARGVSDGERPASEEREGGEQA